MGTPNVYLESYDTDAFSGDDVLDQIKDSELKVGCNNLLRMLGLNHLRILSH